MLTEAFLTCYDTWSRYSRASGEQLIASGYYGIDPDGSFGVTGYQVYCDFPYYTQISHNGEKNMFLIGF